MPLWPHQQQAVQDLRRRWAFHRRLRLIMACGTGKTRAGAGTFSEVTASRLITVPTRELLAQHLHDWEATVGRAAMGTVMAICGHGASMRRQMEEDGSILDVQVTRDPRALAEAARSGGPLTVATTYDSLRIVSEAHERHGLPRWDGIIADEAHRTVNMLGRAWTAIHDDARVPSALRLYMTATPRVVKSSGAATDLTTVASMDNEQQFGPVGHYLSFAEARRRGLLADYRIVVSAVSDAEALRLARRTPRHAMPDPFQINDTRAISAPVLAAQIALLRAADEHGLRKIITYHHRVKDAVWFARTLPEVADWLGYDRIAARLRTGSVYSEQPREARRTTLQMLGDDEPGVVIVANARVLAEGINAPAVDGIMFVDAKGSPIDVIQAVGRAMRLGDAAHKTATVIIPLLLPPGHSPEHPCVESLWAPVWSVVRALRAHDETLSASLDGLRHELGAKEPRALYELPDWLSVTGIPIDPGFARAIYTRTVRASTPLVEEYLGAAHAYREQHGDLLVPYTHHTPNGLALGAWNHAQRAAYRAGTITPTTRDRLTALGMVWDVEREQRRQLMEGARAYAQRTGSLATVPYRHREGGVDLHTALARIRSGDVRLPPEDYHELVRLGMPNTPAVSRRARRAAIVAAAVDFAAEHGHLIPPPHHLVDIGGELIDLDSELDRIRKRYWNGQLLTEHLQALEEAGIIWSRRDLLWERFYQDARAYRRRHGNLFVPVGYTTPDDPPRLLGAQISRNRASCQDTTRRERLTALGMFWEARRRAHYQHLEAARIHARAHGELAVAPDEVVVLDDGTTIHLARWLTTLDDTALQQVHDHVDAALKWPAEWWPDPNRETAARVPTSLHSTISKDGINGVS
ncbi:Helicase associated domain protein [Streptomyces sp. NPDC054796]